MKPKIYIDTSVVGGYFDVEFEEATKSLFERLQRKEIIFVVSDLLETELVDAPKRARNLLYKFPNDCYERVILNQEAIELANTYIKEKVVGKTSLEDCRHITLQP